MAGARGTRRYSWVRRKFTMRNLAMAEHSWMHLNKWGEETYPLFTAATFLEMEVSPEKWLLGSITEVSGASRRVGGGLC